MKLGIIPEQGGSITNLHKTGQDVRFLNYYLKSYTKSFSSVYYFSYISEKVDLPNNSYIISNKNLHRWLYAFLLPLIHTPLIKNISVFRVMQAYGSIPAALIKLLFNKPFICTYGYNYFEHSKFSNQKLRSYLFRMRAHLGAKVADKVIVTNQTMYRYVSKITNPNKLAMIPNGVDTILFSPRGINTNSSEFRLIFIGRLTPEKNIFTIIDAIKLLKPLGMSLIIVGDGPEKNHLQAYAADNDVDCKFMSVVPNDRLPEILRQADVFILPSRVEGNPKVLLEAMSCGLTCIGSDIPGINEIICHNENGLLSKPDPESYAYYIQLALEDRNLSYRLGQNARNYIINNHEIKTLIDKEISLLLSLIA